MPVPPTFPIGAFDQVAIMDDAHKERSIETIEAAPQSLRRSVEGLTDNQIDTPYCNWTIRQIIHHVADSHMNSYIRFKWALTEDAPLIKSYDETAWSELPDARTADIALSLHLLEGLHQRWSVLLRTMTDLDFERTFTHPETGELVHLSLALPYYAWHGRHHTAQIEWVRTRRLR